MDAEATRKELLGLNILLRHGAHSQWPPHVTASTSWVVPSMWDAAKVSKVTSIIEHCINANHVAMWNTGLLGFPVPIKLDFLLSIHAKLLAKIEALQKLCPQFPQPTTMSTKDQQSAQLSTMRAEHAAKVAKLTEDNRQLETQMATMTERCHQQQKQQETLAAELQKMCQQSLQLSTMSPEDADKVAKLTEDNRQLEIQLATMTERCHQQETSAVESMSQQPTTTSAEDAAKVTKLTEDNRQLEIQLATMTERCHQQEKQQETLHAENVRLRGELSDLMGKVALSLQVPPTSPSEGGHAWWSAPRAATRPQGQDDATESIADISTGSWIMIGGHGGYPSSTAWFRIASDAASFISAGTQQSHCFVSDAIFKTKSGESTFFLPAHELQKGSLVMADDGLTLLEVVTIPETHETGTVVELRAGEAVLCVTKDHRIPMLLDKSGERCEVQASKLKLGNFVFVNGVPTALTSIQETSFTDKLEVIKIGFKPDLAVGVFTCPPMISSKGYKVKSLRRSGMNKRGQSGAEVHAYASMPDTASGEYKD